MNPIEGASINESAKILSEKVMRKSILLLSDQGEWHRLINIVRPLLNSHDLSLVNVLPVPPKQEILNSARGVFSRIYAWEDFPGAQDSRKTQLVTMEFIEKTLRLAKWPESAEAVLTTDKSAHNDATGRFFLKPNRVRAMNNFYIGYCLTKQAIENGCPSFCVTHLPEDTSKIGAMCAALTSGLKLLTPVSTKVGGYKLASITVMTQKRLLTTYYGFEGDVPVKIVTKEFLPGQSAIRIKPTNYFLNFGVVDAEESQERVESITRDYHTIALNIQNDFNLEVIKNVASGLKRAARILLSLPMRLLEPALNRKEKSEVIAHCVLKSLFNLHIAIAPVGRIFKAKYFAKQIASSKRNILALHVVPETSSIGGAAWSAVRTELDLLSNDTFLSRFHGSNTQVVEHPAYQRRGFRPRVFWKSFEQKGFRDCIKYSEGVALKDLSEFTVISIEGSISLEAVAVNGRSIIMKPHPMLCVDGIEYIGNYLGVGTEKIDVINEAKVTYEQYIQGMRRWGLLESDISKVCAVAT